MNVSPWTAEEDRYILAAREQGALFRVIGAALNRSADTISTRHKSLLAGTVKIGQPYRDQRHWTPEERELVRSEWLAGTSVEDIAQRLNRPRSVVHVMLRKIKQAEEEREAPESDAVEPCAIHAEAVMAQGGFCWLSEKSLGGGRYAVCLPLNYPSKEV